MIYSTLKNWIQASRPKTLLAGLSPVLLGSAYAFSEGTFLLLTFIATLFSAIFIQIGTNLVNDYYDFKKGADTASRKGPTRVTQAGLISPKHVKLGFYTCFILAFIIGLYLMYIGGIPIIIIGLSSLLFAYMYTGGPFPLGYKGLGDIFVFAYFGPIAVAGTSYLQTLTFSINVVVLGFIPGLLSVAILTVNNLRDSNEDALVDKKTLVVRFGNTFGKIEYTLMIVFSLLVPFYLSSFGNPILSFNTIFIGSLSLLGIFSLMLIKSIWSKTGSDLNPYLGKTALFLIIYTVIITLSFFTYTT